MSSTRNIADEMTARCKADGMSEAQTAYAIALTHHDAVVADFEEQVKARGLLFTDEMSDEDFERVDVAREEIRDQIGLRRVRSTLREAEGAMIKWSLDSLARRFPAKATELAETWELLQKNVGLEPWRRTVDIAFRGR